MKRTVRWATLLLGITLFAWVIGRAGPQETCQAMAALGWGAPLIVLPHALVYACDNLGWALSFGRYAARRPGYGMLFRIRWAGESVNYIVPSAYVGGEAVKAWLLHRRGYSGLTAGTSVVIARTCQTLAQVLFIAMASCLALPHLDPAAGARRGMLLVTLGAGAVVVFLFILQGFGMFRFMLWLGSWLPFRLSALEKNRDHLLQVDGQIRQFYRGDPARFLGCTGAYLTGWMTNALEIWLAGMLMGHPVMWGEALAIEAFISVAKAVGIVLPGALGVQESGVILLFNLFGYPVPMAAAYALIRRGREILFALVGAGFLWREGLSMRGLLRGERWPMEAETKDASKPLTGGSES